MSQELKDEYFGESNFNKKVKEYIKQAKFFFKNWDDDSYLYIVNNSDEILQGLNKVVNIFQKESKNNSIRLEITATIILLGIVVILLLEAKFIFIPIQKENKKHEKNLKKLNKLLQEKIEAKTGELTQLLEHVGQYVIITKIDTQGRLIYCSDAFCEKTKFEKNKILGLIHPLFQTKKVDMSDLSSLGGNEIYETKIQNTNIEGETYWLNVKITPILGVHNKVSGYLAICTDITEEMKEREYLEKTNQKLETLASTCSLTNIYNRRVFEELLSSEIAMLKRYPIRKSSLIFMDIDHFKQVNDTYGHLKGDEILVGFSSLLIKELRNSDIFARWGGEEFVVLLKDTNLSQAILKANSLREKIASAPISDVSITCSFGVVELNKDSTIQSIIKEADELLYIAKQKGRNLVISS